MEEKIRLMKFKLVLIFLLISFLSFSQTKETAIRDAKITANATIDGKYKTLIKHTLPGIVNMMGGEESATKIIKKSMEEMASQGFVFEKAEITEVSKIVNEQNQFRCYVQNSSQLKMGDKRIKSKSYLLGIYDTKKKIWYFVESKLLKNKAMIDKVLPEFETSLKIPDNEMKTEIVK